MEDRTDGLDVSINERDVLEGDGSAFLCLRWSLMRKRGRGSRFSYMRRVRAYLCMESWLEHAEGS
jgi:hypothetical protein